MAIKCKNVVKFDGVSFNRDWVLSHKSEADFSKAAKRYFSGDTQDAKLKELYKVAKAQADAEAKAAVEAKAAKTGAVPGPAPEAK